MILIAAVDGQPVTFSRRMNHLPNGALGLVAHPHSGLVTYEIPSGVSHVHQGVAYARRDCRTDVQTLSPVKRGLK